MATTMSLIAKQTVGASGAASVVFSSIPQTYTDLKVVISARTSVAGNTDAIALAINGYTTNLSGRYVFYNGNTGSALNSGTAISGQEGGWINGNTSTAAAFSNSEIYFPNYSSNAAAKSFSIDSAQDNKATGTNSMYMGLWAEVWNPGTQEGITSLTLTPSANYSQYTTIYLYGISNNVSAQNNSVPYASGGDVITTDGTYWYHAFKYSGSFTPLKNLTADVLVVAGGGGTSQDSGGGGAGGLLTFSAQALTNATAYTCTVGAGGTQSSGTNDDATSGVNSQFGALTACVGGGRARFRSQNPTGGSGAGGNSNNAGGTTTPGSGTSGQGYAGGSADFCTGGGGGAGGVGGNASGSSIGGTGGIGATSALLTAMGSATSTGQLSSGNYYYAGGGAGWYGSPAAGLGGGGAQSSNGTANTGGGAGAYRGNGGSGIIIVRYAV